MGIRRTAVSSRVQRSSANARFGVGTVASWQAWHSMWNRGGQGAPSRWPVGAPCVVTNCGLCPSAQSGTDEGSGIADCISATRLRDVSSRHLDSRDLMSFEDLANAQGHNDGCYGRYARPCPAHEAPGGC